MLINTNSLVELSVMTTLADRLIEALQKAGLSQSELARRIGVKPQSIQAITSGRVKTTVHMHKIARELNVDTDWLETGRLRKENKTNVEIIPGKTVSVPLISWVQAGNWCGVHDPYPVGLGEKMIVTQGNVSAHAFALRIEGDSMVNPHGIPSFPPGAIIIVDPARQWENGSFVVAKNQTEGTATFKQLVIVGGLHYLKPLNPKYPMLSIDENIIICGVVRSMVFELD